MMRDDVHLPPHSIEAEQSVLGAILLDNGALDRINGGLTPEHFYLDTHRMIFRAERELRDTGKPVDVVTLGEALGQVGKLDYVGGMTYLGTLLQNVPTAANVTHYASIIRERAQLRAIMGAAHTLAETATNPLGRSVADILTAARETFANINGDPHEPLPLLWARDASPDVGVNYLIKGILAAGELAVVYGAPKSGKTFVTLDLGMTVANADPDGGTRWFGHRVRPATVIYIASEMGERVMRRVRAWMDHSMGDASNHDPALAVVPRAVNLLDPEAVERLVTTVRGTIAKRGTGRVLVVIDTLSRSMPGGDENAVQDMARALAVADRLRDEFNAATLVLHHTGKTPNGPRGSSWLAGAVDSLIRIEHDEQTKVREIHLEWSRDGEAGARHGFALRPVDLGVDDDGEHVSTCLVEPSDALPEARGPKPRKLNATAVVALDVLRAVISDHGEPLPATSAIPPGKRGVKRDAWRDRFHAVRPIEATDPVEARREAAARKKAFQRARDDLLAANVVGTINDYWWIA